MSKAKRKEYFDTMSAYCQADAMYTYLTAVAGLYNIWEQGLKEHRETVVWLNANFYTPSESGEYFVSDGKGRVKQMLYTNANGCRILFDTIMAGHYDEVYYAFEDSEWTDKDLLNLYKNQTGIWYQIEDADPENCALVIFRGEQVPKYFMKNNLHGPIDTDDKPKGV